MLPVFGWSFSRTLEKGPVERGLGPESRVEGDIQNGPPRVRGRGQPPFNVLDAVGVEQSGESDVHFFVENPGQLMGRNGQTLGEGPEREIVVLENFFDLEKIDEPFSDLLGPFGIKAEFFRSPGLGFRRSFKHEKARGSSRRENSEDDQQRDSPGRDGLLKMIFSNELHAADCFWLEIDVIPLGHGFEVEFLNDERQNLVPRSSFAFIRPTLRGLGLNIRTELERNPG